MEKISQMLLDISQGYVDDDLSLIEKESLMKIVGSAWNIACIEPPARFDELYRYMQDFKMRQNLSSEDYSNMEHDLMTLMEQKDLLFPDIKTRVVDVKMHLKNGEETLSVFARPFTDIQ